MKSDRGGKFFVLDRHIWDRLWTIKTPNRLNLVTTLLVLLAGTGADHRLTKWSAKACEVYAGIGKPRAQRTIEELIETGLAEYANLKRDFPQYRLAEPQSLKEPIFLPVQLVSGLETETPILRRIRQAGDPYLLRMLIDLYGLVQTDATHGIPLTNLREYSDEPEPCRKVAEIGANTIWALLPTDTSSAAGDWRNVHHLPKCRADDQPFWPRVRLLQNLGILWFEPWVFAGPELDAEPLFPLADTGMTSPQGAEVKELAATMSDAVEALAGGRAHLLQQHAGTTRIALPTHYQVPALRGVARLRVEADTPGRRLAFAKRMQAIELAKNAYKEVALAAEAGRFNVPLKLS